MKYAFSYTSDASTLRHELGLDFGAPILTLGGNENLKFVRAFGSDTVYQVGSALPSPKPYLVEGTVTTLSLLDNIELLRIRMQTCTRLFRTNDTGGDEVYVDCKAGAMPIDEQIRFSSDSKSNLAKVNLYFWVTYYKWKQTSDDAEVLI